VTAASAEMHATAGSMTATAEEPAQATAVANASTEASSKCRRSRWRPRNACLDQRNLRQVAQAPRPPIWRSPRPTAQRDVQGLAARR